MYDPNNCKTYKCKMELPEPDMLTIRGYLGVPVFGRTELWTRQSAAPEQRASD